MGIGLKVYGLLLLQLIGLVFPLKDYTSQSVVTTIAADFLEGSINTPAIIHSSALFTPDNLMNADSIIIPMKRAGRLFLIEAKVEDQTGKLVFDTGANGLVFNSTYFRNHLKSEDIRSNGITGSVGSVGQIVVSRFELAELTFKNVQADVANLGHIENKRGIKILGLFGFAMIRNMEIIIDAKNNELKLYRIDKEGNRAGNSGSSFFSDHSQRIGSTNNILFIEGSIGGKRLNFCFDTGAETNVISSYSSKSVLNTLTITRRSGLSGAGSSGSEVLFGRMNDFKIGDKQIPGMETIVTNLDALSEAYGTKIDGMLGYNFIEQGTLCINFVKKQFSIRFMKGEVP